MGMEYLLAGCSMSEEERLAVKDVTKAARFQCDDCPISFTMENNLEEHIARKHKKKISLNNSKSKEILDAIDRKNAIDGEFSKTMKTFKTASDSLKKTNIATISPKSTPKATLEKVVQGLSAKKLKTLDVSIKKDGEEVEMKRKNLTSTTSVPKKNTSKLNKTGNGSTPVAEPGQEPGEGKVCPLCSKEFLKNGPMRRHFEDIHQPGEFPCSGCQKMFTSKNKMSSHYSRYCNSNGPRKRRKLSDVKLESIAIV